MSPFNNINGVRIDQKKAGGGFTPFDLWEIYYNAEEGNIGLDGGQVAEVLNLGAGGSDFNADQSTAAEQLLTLTDASYNNVRVFENSTAQAGMNLTVPFDINNWSNDLSGVFVGARTSSASFGYTFGVSSPQENAYIPNIQVVSVTNSSWYWSNRFNGLINTTNSGDVSTPRCWYWEYDGSTKVITLYDDAGNSFNTSAASFVNAMSYDQFFRSRIVGGFRSYYGTIGALALSRSINSREDINATMNYEASRLGLSWTDIP